METSWSDCRTVSASVLRTGSGAGRGSATKKGERGDEDGGKLDSFESIGNGFPDNGFGEALDPSVSRLQTSLPSALNVSVGSATVDSVTGGLDALGLGASGKGDLRG